MAHDPSKCNCSSCRYCKSIICEGVETGRYCKADGKTIEFWGKDNCPIE